ncbi:hypothetical protein KAR91_11335 [Candidatus Pacearchaeota archaeon]|nr:hypothetical protein [Candidatus Pacearchaeota archaeon]
MIINNESQTDSSDPSHRFDPSCLSDSRPIFSNSFFTKFVGSPTKNDFSDPEIGPARGSPQYLALTKSTNKESNNAPLDLDRLFVGEYEGSIEQLFEEHKEGYSSELVNAYDFFYGHRSEDSIVKNSDYDYVLAPIKDEIEGFTLPGHDGIYRTKEEFPKNYCGKFRGLFACPDHYHDHKIILNTSCDKASCVIDFRKWATKGARRAYKRYIAFMLLLFEKGIYIGLPKHVILSPHPAHALGLIRKGQYGKLKKEVINIAKNSGIIGGTLVFHMWRCRCQKCDKSKDDCECKDPCLRWIFGPHFHILGYGWVLGTTRFREIYPNWIIKNKGTRQGKDIYKTLSYEIGHAALHKKTTKNRQAITWFGELSYNKFSSEKMEILEYIECNEEDCGQPFHKLLAGFEINGNKPDEDLHDKLDIRKKDEWKVQFGPRGITKETSEGITVTSYEWDKFIPDPVFDHKPYSYKSYVLILKFKDFNKFLTNTSHLRTIMSTYRYRMKKEYLGEKENVF